MFPAIKALCVPACVACGHVFLLYGVASVSGGGGNADRTITVELVSSSTEERKDVREEESPQEQSLDVGAIKESSIPSGEGTDDTGATVEDSRAFDDSAETQSPALYGAEYETKEISEAASGNDGDVRGDGLDYSEKQSAENTISPNASEGDVADSGTEKIGEQGNPDSLLEGDYGSGGDGGTAAYASARYRHRVAPKYPRADEIAGHEGTVVLILKIGVRGDVLGVSVKKSSGYRSLDNAAIRAARAATYIPAQQGSKVVESMAEASYTFQR